MSDGVGRVERALAAQGVAHDPVAHARAHEQVQLWRLSLRAAAHQPGHDPAVDR